MSLPCPFCGGTDIISRDGARVNICSDCDACGPICFGETPEDAWSRRANTITIDGHTYTEAEFRALIEDRDRWQQEATITAYALEMSQQAVAEMGSTLMRLGESAEEQTQP